MKLEINKQDQSHSITITTLEAKIASIWVLTLSVVALAPPAMKIDGKLNSNILSFIFMLLGPLLLVMSFKYAQRNSILKALASIFLGFFFFVASKDMSAWFWL